MGDEKKAVQWKKVKQKRKWSVNVKARLKKSYVCCLCSFVPGRVVTAKRNQL